MLFRLGDFFELFFEDAVKAAPILGVTLTSRPLGKSERAPMCGVPHHAWQAYAGKLLRAGHKVVICDQVETAGKGLVRREVTRVLTPGTVVEDAYLDPTESNYLVAAWSKGRAAGLAACDVAGGLLLLCQLPAARLQAELQRLRPAELLTPPAVPEYKFDPERGAHRLLEVLNIGFAASVGAGEAPLAVGAAGVILEYLAENQFQIEPGLFHVRTYSIDDSMQIDPATARNLELPALMRLLNRSSTSLGARTLRAWVRAPLRDVEAVNLRLGAVAQLERDRHRRYRIEGMVKQVGDLERLVVRACQRISPARELVALKHALHALPGLLSTLEGIDALALRELGGRVTPQGELWEVLERALVEQTGAGEQGAIRQGFDAELDGIRDASHDARQWIASLEARERERTGIRTLKVGFNRVFGYYIEVGNAQKQNVPADYAHRQTLVGAERYLTPELKERETIVLNADHDLALREQQILRELQDQIAARAGQLLETARAIGELDALASFADIAGDRGWTRPSVMGGTELLIEAGRHPLVEAALPPGSFVPNDVAVDSGASQVVILTGPNMAGKSTYLRQCALIALLAQCGSFVPARSAALGICDRIFTRVGAQDDLAAGASTFMVEMMETANILNHATATSLVILDEVGRGTSTYDGVSIAQAVVEHIHDRLGCRTLFATHYHELTSLAERLSRVSNYRMEVIEEGGEVRFLHRVVPGGADRSYGIHVAALAGLPPQVVRRARQVLLELEARRPLEPPDHQLKLALEAPPDPIRRELAELDINRLSPLEALQKLNDIRTQLAAG